MAALEIHQVPVLGDNYVYLCRDPSTGAVAAVDPAVAPPVRAALDRLGWKLTHILITHDHGDHTGGNSELKRAYGCKVVGARADRNSIPGLDQPVGDGDEVAIGGQRGQVFEVPGHTLGHIAYWFPQSRALFPGDTLFTLGCGRLFGGSAAQMWSSLKRLRDLPADTLVYCAHEYTEANARFALAVEPDNPRLIQRAAKVGELRRAGKPTVPATLAEEVATNPFLRADDEALQGAAGLAGEDAGAVFAEIRRRKDNF